MTLRGSQAPVVHLVDDDDAVLRSLALLLRSHGRTTLSYASAEQFLARIDRLEPGCAIIDVRLPGLDGIGLLRALNAQNAGVPVVIVTGHADVALAVQAMKDGAVDFVEKPYTEEAMLGAVDAAIARARDARVVRAAAEQATARLATLTPRERDVLQRLLEGFPNKMMAQDLGISPRTVEIHRAKVMEKLACRSLADVIRLATAAGLG